jgi:hypothetical protein
MIKYINQLFIQHNTYTLKLGILFKTKKTFKQVESLFAFLGCSLYFLIASSMELQY